MLKLGEYQSFVVDFIYLFFLIKGKNDEYLEIWPNIFKKSVASILKRNLKLLKQENKIYILTIVADILLTLLRA